MASDFQQKNKGFISGIVHKLGDIKEGIKKNGQGKWYRRDLSLMFDNDGKAQFITLTAWAEEAKDINNTFIGAEVNCEYTITSREWQERHYPSFNLTSIKVVKFAEISNDVILEDKSGIVNFTDDLPF